MRDLAAIRLLSARLVGVLIGCYAIFMLAVAWQSQRIDVQTLIGCGYLVLLLAMAIGTVFALRLARLALSLLLVIDACVTVIMPILAARACGNACQDLTGYLIGAAILLIAAGVVYPGWKRPAT